MDAVIVLGIAGLGYILNSEEKTERHVDKVYPVTNVASYKPTNRTAYENTQYDTARATEARVVDDYFQKSKDPWKTSIVPQRFNSTPGALTPPQPSNTMQPNQMSIGDPVPNDMFSGSMLTTSTLPETVVQQNNYFNHNIMHPGVTGTDTPAVVPPFHTGPANPLLRPEADRNVNQRSQIEPFHNNMVPFFGGKLTQNMDLDQNQHTLELFTGDRALKADKKETANFFNPVKNTTVNGSYDFDQHRERYEVSGTQQGIKPFQPVRVGVGVNEGPTSRPTGGFHDMYRPHIKTVDELRVGSQPKMTYAGRVLPPKAQNAQRGKIGEMFKNLPETAFKQTHDNLFKTTGAVTKAKAPENFFVKNTNRKSSASYGGIAGPTGGEEKTSSRPRVQQDNRQSLKTTGPRNAGLSEGWTVAKLRNQRRDTDISDYGKNSIANYDNERTFTQCRTTVSNIKPVNKRETAKPEDKAKTTRKQQYVTYTRQGNVEKTVSSAPIYNLEPARTTIKETNIHDTSTGNMGRQAPCRTTMYTPDDKARTTIRETNIHDASTGHMGRQAPAKAVMYVPGDKTRTTIRETNIHDTTTGNMGRQAPSRSVMYVPGDKARTTIKETNVHNKSTGNVGRQGPANHIMYTPDDRARTTIKETLIHDTRAGNIHVDVKQTTKDQYDKDEWRMRTTLREAFPDGACGQKRNPTLSGAQQSTARNLDKARTTIKETVIDNAREGNVATDKVQQTIRPTDPVRTTIKETTIDDNRAGNVNAVLLQQGTGYETANVEAKDIARQYLADTEHFNDPARDVGQGYLTNPKEFKDTMRQYVSDYEYVGNAGKQTPAQMSQEDMQCATFNVIKEVIAKGRDPTQTSTKVAAGQEQLGDVESSRLLPTEDLRDLSVAKTYQVIASPNPCEVTKESNQTAELENNRLDAALMDAYRSNPYTQSLNSY